jgi:hypothetical protein
LQLSAGSSFRRRPAAQCPTCRRWPAGLPHGSTPPRH